MENLPMNEPTLESMEDYNTLSGEKRKVVWAVIIAGLLIGAIYAGAKSYFGTVDDAILTTDKAGHIPVK